jgi:LysM repeat protein
MMSSRRHVRSASIVCVVILLMTMLLPAVSQAAMFAAPSEEAAVSVRLQPALPPRSQAPQQAGPTATNTLTPTQQLQALEQQMHEAYNRSDWAEVLRLIEALRAIDPAYKAPELRETEYQARLAHGWDLMLSNQCLEALNQFRLALLIKPGDTQANQGLDAVARYCKTPVPTATPSGTPATPTPTTPAGGSTYVVHLGDTLYSISKKFGVSITALMQANGLTNYDIRAGQVLVIPGGVATPTSTPTGTLTPSATYVLPTPIAHVVQPGETLCALARRYNTSVWAIMAYNRLYTTTIFAYSTLLIPPAPQAGPVIHVVQAGNTLYSLARAYHTTIWAIMAANGLSNANIYVGQSLVIPTGPYEWYPGYPTGDPCGGPIYARTYVVKPGDTLYSIARMFGTTVGALKALNSLTSDLIYVGTVLYIPGQA